MPYLVDQWMDAVGWTVEEAKQLGMEIWLYDEPGQGVLFFLTQLSQNKNPLESI